MLTRELTVLSEFGALYQRTRFPVAVLPLLPLLMGICIYLPVYAVVVGLLGGWVASLKAVIILPALWLGLFPVVYCLPCWGYSSGRVGKCFPLR